MPNPFRVLGLNPNATDDDIKKAWKQLALKYHPDRNLGKDTTEKMKAINNAKDLLLNPEKRRDAEADFRSAGQGTPSGNRSDSSKAGGSSSNSRSSSGNQKASGGWDQQWAGSDWDEKTRRPKMDKNVHVKVRINPKRAKLGGYIKIRVRYAYGPAKVPIHVPANVREGLEQVYKGWGQYGDDQNIIGDLVVTFIIDPGAKDSGKDYGDFYSQSRGYEEDAEVIDEDAESDPFENFRETFQKKYEESRNQYNNFQSGNHQKGAYGNQNQGPNQNFQSRQHTYNQTYASNAYTQGAIKRFLQVGGIVLVAVIIISAIIGSSQSSNSSYDTTNYSSTGENSESDSSGNKVSDNPASVPSPEEDVSGSIGLPESTSQLPGDTAAQDPGATRTIGE